MKAHHFFKPIILISIFLISGAAGCSDKAEDPKPDNYTSLTGYWMVKVGQTFARKDDGTIIITANLKPDVVAIELRADGTMTSFDHTGHFAPAEGTWKLEVTKLNGTDIQEGHLFFYSKDFNETAGEHFYEADGAMKFSIRATTTSNKLSHMTLTTKKIESYPYKENWGVYLYEKH